MRLVVIYENARDFLGIHTENTYLFVTVMAIFARQYEPMLAIAWVEAEEDMISRGCGCDPVPECSMSAFFSLSTLDICWKIRVLALDVVALNIIYVNSLIKMHT